MNKEINKISLLHWLLACHLTFHLLHKSRVANENHHFVRNSTEIAIVDCQANGELNKMKPFILLSFVSLATAYSSYSKSIPATRYQTQEPKYAG